MTRKEAADTVYKLRNCGIDLIVQDGIVRGSIRENSQCSDAVKELVLNVQRNNDAVIDILQNEHRIKGMRAASAMEIAQRVRAGITALTDAVILHESNELWDISYIGIIPCEPEESSAWAR